VLHPSIRLPIRPVPSIYMKSESRTNFKFDREMTMDTSKWGANLSSKRSKVKVNRNEKVKIIFRTYFGQKWIDLHRTMTKMTFGSLYTYR